MSEFKLERLFRAVDAVNAIVPGCHLVGGAVRDALMNEANDDLDFATFKLPEEVVALGQAAGRKVWMQGRDMGTVSMKVLVDGEYEKVDISTFKSEEWDGGRRPSNVHFVTSLHEDLARRDFTMNAIALSPKHKLIDPFDGASDIARRIIRAVGNPTLRFNEDPQRMMRACRFQATKGFSIDLTTYKSMSKRPHRILRASKERWMMEMDKLLMGEHAGAGLECMWQTGLMAYILPEMQPQYYMDQVSPHHKLLLHEHTKRVVEGVPNDLNLKWAAFLHDVGKPASQHFKPRMPDMPDHATYIKHELIGAELVEGIALRLKWSRDQRESVTILVKEHLNDWSPLRSADNAAKG